MPGPQWGLVGVFDVLGYSSILRNNDTLTCARIITQILENLPEVAKNRILALAGDGQEKDLHREVLDRIHFALISDTIIFTLPIKERAITADSAKEIVIYLGACSTLLRRAFDVGLPLRGAIHHGEYFAKATCFAGVPLVSAFEDGNKLQFSGAVIEKSLATSFFGFLPTPLLKLLVTEIAVVEKLGVFRRFVLNTFRPYAAWDPLPMDRRQYVIKAFSDHNKDLTLDARSKIENTEILLRQFDTLKLELPPETEPPTSSAT